MALVNTSVKQNSEMTLYNLEYCLSIYKVIGGLWSISMVSVGLMCLSIEWKLYTCRNSIPAGGPIVDEFFSTIPG